MKSSVATLLALIALASAAPAKRQCTPTSTMPPPPPETSMPPPESTMQPPESSMPPAPTSTEVPPPTETPPPSGGGGGSSGYGGPIFSVYADWGIDAGAWPSSGDMGGWNDLLLAFYLTDGRGAFDVSAVWQGLDSGAKQSIIDDYHAAGKKIRVSVFGATDMPLQHGGDPVAIGNEVAKFVQDNMLDGVDLDYEDSGSFNANGDGENFLITLTKTLRDQLPSPKYIISHAPQSPYFTTAGWYPQGAYTKIHKEVGDMIDFYNVQFYNQGNIYEDCESLFDGNAATLAGTSVAEIIAQGIPASKLIVGKPGASSDASNGYMDPATLGGCIKSTSHKPGGVMAWQWDTAKPDWIASARGDL